MDETMKNLFGDLDKYMLYIQEILGSNDAYRIDETYNKANLLASILYNGRIHNSLKNL